MSRPRKAVPIPREHKGSAVLDEWMHGRRKQLVLGPWKSEKADVEYRRIIAEYATGTYDRPSGNATVHEINAVHLVHAEQHYRRLMVPRLTREMSTSSPIGLDGPVAGKK